MPQSAGGWCSADPVLCVYACVPSFRVPVCSDLLDAALWCSLERSSFCPTRCPFLRSAVLRGAPCCAAQVNKRISEVRQKRGLPPVLVAAGITSVPQPAGPGGGLNKAKPKPKAR